MYGVLNKFDLVSFLGIMNVNENEEAAGPGATEQAVNFSCHTLDKATKAKLTLENYYNNLISQHRERQERLRRLEESLSDKGLEEEIIAERRNQHAAKETEFLRLKRSRLGVDDFEPIKVIGKGALGDASVMKWEH